MLEGIKELRNIAEQELGQQRNDLTFNMEEKLRKFTSDVQIAAQTAAEKLQQEVNDAAGGDTVVSAERERLEAEIKNIFYRDDQNQKDLGAEAKKAEIKALLEGFEDFVEN